MGVVEDNKIHELNLQRRIIKAEEKGKCKEVNY